ncbi:MAG: glucose-1-phosphate adenylyltransferase subunit GlgD [Clostridiales bacterium]|nr:glucose-1-phosphate adenylyltransferase subunit GlgD [Clostridiales bacterium]
MLNVLGINFAYNDRENLRELTQLRTLASLPIAGKYRIIDFILSGFVNSGINDISIITKNNYHSLVDHVGAGNDWDLNRKIGGIRILTPLSQPGMLENVGLYKGTAEALARNLHSIKRTVAEYVIMTGSSVVCCSIDYEELLHTHIKSGADITAVYANSLNGYKKVPLGIPVFFFDDNMRLIGLRENEDDITRQEATWSVGIFVIKKSLLEALVSDCIARGGYSFYYDILDYLKGNLMIKGYHYNKQLFEISDVTGYMNANMNFLKSDFRDTAFEKPIYTKVKDSVPTIYCEGCSVRNSIVADGCKIQGTVEDGIISRGVKIGRGAVVRNCIVMQNAEIMSDVELQYVIIDKDVIVREGQKLIGHEKYPVVVEKRSIV